TFSRTLYTPPDLTRTLSFSFFFLCSRDPPPLHSFPTRRSSDLRRTLVALALTLLVPLGAAAGAAGKVVIAQGVDPTTLDMMNQRSEEHTSELQSPYDLVCRLLLEKKKQKQ